MFFSGPRKLFLKIVCGAITYHAIVLGNSNPKQVGNQKKIFLGALAS